MPVKTNFPIVSLSSVPQADYQSSAKESPTILLVHPERIIADTLSLIFNTNGFLAMTAYNVSTAMESALLAPPQLLIVDGEINHKNGNNLAASIREIAPDCKVILFVGHVGMNGLTTSLYQDENDIVFMTKPIHPATVLARARECFQAMNRKLSYALGDVLLE